MKTEIVRVSIGNSCSVGALTPKAIYNQVRKDLIEIIQRLSSYKEIETIEGHMMPNHVHILVLIPPNIPFLQS